VRLQAEHTHARGARALTASSPISLTGTPNFERLPAVRTWRVMTAPDARIDAHEDLRSRGPPARHSNAKTLSMVTLHACVEAPTHTRRAAAKFGV
jgi:hypothetical protein